MKPKALITAVVLLATLFVGRASAESVEVEYQGEVPLDTFECEDVTRSSFIDRVCYDADNQYMVISLSGTYYGYCEIDQTTVDDLLAASSMGAFYNKEIKGNNSDSPFDCRTHTLPDYSE